MLTGGPSVWYARRLVSDPTASILITGYQDEEAPGKKLLDAAGKKNVLLELGTHQICVACTIEKYSLSAHADGGELASYAEHLRPRRIALVHGDEQARSALQQLLQRQAEILLPQDGETLAITEKQSPLSSPARNPLPLQELPQNIGRGEIFNASHLPILWQALHTLPSHSIFTIRDLVSVWYGSTTIPEYSWSMEDVLEEQQPYDKLYFARITSLPETYRLCEFHQEEQETHLAHLPGLIVLLESHPYAAKPVLIRAREAENIIRVLHPHGEWDKHLRYPLKRIKEIIGPLTLQEEGKSERTQLTNMTRAARHLRKSISAHAMLGSVKKQTPIH
jgi:hypothetical protein